MQTQDERDLKELNDWVAGNMDELRAALMVIDRNRVQIGLDELTCIRVQEAIRVLVNVAMGLSRQRRRLS